MRYPVGWRETLERAYQAAIESSQLTGIRYAISKHPEYSKRPWQFRPSELPDTSKHEAVEL